MILRGGSVVLVLVAALAGCEAPVHISPGLSAVRIDIRAEPKAGYRADDSGEYSDFATPRTGRYEPVDYKRLDEVVVWLEPQAALAAKAIAVPLVIDLAPSKLDVEAPLFVASVGSEVVVRNGGPAAEAIYSVARGNAFHLGAIAPGGEARTAIRGAGELELLSEARAEPIARIYAAPSAWIALGRGGRPVTFTDLPPGHYRVKSWHRRLPSDEMAVELRPDQLGRVTLVVSVNVLQNP